MGHLIRGGSSILHEGTTDARTIMPNAGNQNSDGVYSSREGTAIPLAGEHEPESRCIDTCGRCTLHEKNVTTLCLAGGSILCPTSFRFPI